MAITRALHQGEESLLELTKQVCCFLQVHLTLQISLSPLSLLWPRLIALNLHLTECAGSVYIRRVSRDGVKGQHGRQLPRGCLCDRVV